MTDTIKTARFKRKYSPTQKSLKEWNFPEFSYLRPPKKKIKKASQLKLRDDENGR